MAGTQRTDDGGQSNDPELLRRYADGKSEAAFAELVRRHLNLVYFAALRSTGGNGHLAKDIAQDVFTALARQAPALTRHATLSGWLYTTTRFTAAKMLRHEQRRKLREQEAHLMSERSTESGNAADWERLRPLLDDALDKLNDRDREAVLLRCLEGRAFAEIGATLSVTEDAARMRVDRALDKLHALLAKRGVTSTAAALGVTLSSGSVVAAPAGLAATVTDAAIAGATTVSGGTAGLLTFMSTTKILVGAAALVLAGAGIAIYEASKTQRTTQALTAVVRERDAARAQLATLEKRAQTAEQNNAVVTGRVAALEKQLEAAQRKETPATPGVLPPSVEKLASRPPVDDATVQNEKAKLHRRYDPLLQHGSCASSSPIRVGNERNQRIWALSVGSIGMRSRRKPAPY